MSFIYHQISGQRVVRFFHVVYINTRTLCAWQQNVCAPRSSAVWLVS
jgi:hypothetical protein